MKEEYTQSPSCHFLHYFIVHIPSSWTIFMNYLHELNTHNNAVCWIWLPVLAEHMHTLNLFPFVASADCTSVQNDIILWVLHLVFLLWEDEGAPVFLLFLLDFSQNDIRNLRHTWSHKFTTKTLYSEWSGQIDWKRSFPSIWMSLTKRITTHRSVILIIVLYM